MTDKKYYVTEKQLRKLKELTESDFYWSEEGRELRYLVEDIEAQEIAPETAKGHIIYDKWE